MTTKVVVGVPAPNHRPVDVTICDKQEDGTWKEVEGQQIEVGGMCEYYVHSHRKLTIAEVPEG